MAFQVVHKQRRGGNTTKPLLDLTKKPVDAANAVFKQPAKEPSPKPPVEAKQQRLNITAAPDGPPLAPDLPEKLRTPAPWGAQKTLTEQQTQALDRIIQKAGDGHPKTLGLRLVLAASEDECTASWPIGILSKALGVAGYATASHAVHMVAYGCRVGRFKDMAATSLALLNQKLEADKAD